MMVTWALARWPASCGNCLTTSNRQSARVIRTFSECGGWNGSDIPGSPSSRMFEMCSSRNCWKGTTSTARLSPQFGQNTLHGSHNGCQARSMPRELRGLTLTRRRYKAPLALSMWPTASTLKTSCETDSLWPSMTKCTLEIPSNLGSSQHRGTSLHCSNSKENPTG